MKVVRHLVGICISLLAALAVAQEKGADVGAHGPSQSAADYLREYTGADIAFLAAGQVKDTFQRDNLATLLQYKTDPLMVLNLSGSQIRTALERSLSLYPQSNTSFLQLSGLEVTFSRAVTTKSRLLSVVVGGAKLEDAKMYRVAMPSQLGRGGLGYFKVWDKTAIAKTYDDVTIESVLKGKRLTETTPRWLAQD
ncbi:MAG: 5'-nucleotidase [Fimbriimonas sp.]